ncbi:MAG TPA: MarR family transcriptional regulator [Luteibacter sp.]|uniref:MarR family winged helix-turn-helix transcriptional regulator n=1 Tax=Luteibacter sp. TaxID=1886636 RepID=UPI002B8B16ED|nr:MarR family transcriptional regulator [Luteibacter sp.]HVI54523.1 MarR family transcriptional regulator [Luteibacter sp.]
MNRQAIDASGAPTGALALVGRISRGFARLYEPKLREQGLSLGQVPVFVMLKGGKAMSQSDLARLVRVEQPTMAQLLARMERDGNIVRTADPQDGRSKLISLTADAEKRMPAAKKILFSGEAVALAGFSDAEKNTLVALLERLSANLDRAAEEG